MKHCSKCKELKPKEEFPRSSKYQDGRYPSCKTCHNAKSKESVRTKVGIVPQIYSAQRRNSKLRGHSSPTYSQGWLKVWLLNQPEYHRLYDLWVLTGYNRDFKPSVDRIDDNLGYTEYNIQLMSWKDNATKWYTRNNKENK